MDSGVVLSARFRGSLTLPNCPPVFSWYQTPLSRAVKKSVSPSLSISMAAAPWVESAASFAKLSGSFSNLPPLNANIASAWRSPPPRNSSSVPSPSISSAALARKGNESTNSASWTKGKSTAVKAKSVSPCGVLSACQNRKAPKALKSAKISTPSTMIIAHQRSANLPACFFFFVSAII